MRLTNENRLPVSPNCLHRIEGWWCLAVLQCIQHVIDVIENGVELAEKSVRMEVENNGYWRRGI